MVVSQVIGVGIFLTPAALMRTVGGIGPALGVWVVLGVLRKQTNMARFSST
jgi:hypothetical protein